MRKGFLNTPIPKPPPPPPPTTTTTTELVVVTKEQKAKNAIQLIGQFMLNTVGGTLSGLYKVYHHMAPVHNEYLEEYIKDGKLCDERFWTLFSMQIVQYLVNTDASIRNRQDPYINAMFDPVKRELGRLPCCIIVGTNELFRKFSNQCTQIPTLLNKTSLDDFITSGTTAMSSIIDLFHDNIFQILMKCTEKCSKPLEQEPPKITL